MSSSYALLTAPPVESIYPDLPTDNFRLHETSRIEKEISEEVEHYRLVLKKYKKARKAVHYSAVGLGSVSLVLSSGAIAASLTGVSVIVGAPVAEVAAFTGFASTNMTVLTKKLDRKVDKHSRLLSLATAKHDSINCCVSQAMNNNTISDKEFQLSPVKCRNTANSRRHCARSLSRHPRLLLHSLIWKKSENRFGKSLQKKLVHST